MSDVRGKPVIVLDLNEGGWSLLMVLLWLATANTRIWAKAVLVQRTKQIKQDEDANNGLCLSMGIGQLRLENQKHDPIVDDGGGLR